MKRLGDELLKKCGGLPLAIVVLGGLLAVNKWEVVHKKINLHFGDKSDVSKVLALSYDDLPWYLKPCFLYLGSFPEDAEIPATKVLHMWIAEGFVSLNAYDEQRETQVEDLAEQYLIELVNRGMLQVRFNLSGNIKTCHLHDLMRDLCVSKATQESFLSVLNIIQPDNEKKDCSSSMAEKIDATCKTRRLSLNISVSKEENMIRHLKPKGRAMLHLRTLLFFGDVEGKWEQFQSIFTTYKFLRVLKLEDLNEMGKKLPESVGDLVHLRFLSLARSYFRLLPQSMGKLVCMEFLDLRGGRILTVTVPNVLWKMRRLRHLYLPYQFVVKKSFNEDEKKLRLDTLKNLQTLGNFLTNNCEMNDIGKLINLRKLTFHVDYGADKLEIISKVAKLDLKHLESSSFGFRRESFTEGDLSEISSYQHPCKLLIEGKIVKLPEHEDLPQQLRKLVLSNSRPEEDPLPILEKLQQLVVLMLGRYAFVGKEMVCSA